MIRLTATARPDAGSHRWEVRVLAADGAATDPGPLLEYGSRIGGRDCAQRVEIPAKDSVRRLEIGSRHAVDGDWRDSRGVVDEDTPSCVRLGFSRLSAPVGCPDDVLLNFAFDPARLQPRQDDEMAKGQKKSNREVRKPKQDKVKTKAVPSTFLATAERNTGSGGAAGGKRTAR
jgi:hypothetical protein